MIEQITSDEIIDQAYKWLSLTRHETHHNHDVWHLRFHWDKLKPLIQKEIGPISGQGTSCLTILRLKALCALPVKMLEHSKKFIINKIYIRRIKETGFDFLGRRIIKSNLQAAWTTWENHQDKLLQLYEQGGASAASFREYVKRWVTWLLSGVNIDIKKVYATYQCEPQKLHNIII